MVKWTPKAENDLNEIYTHITDHFSSDLAFERVLKIIDRTEEILERNPLAGKLLESNPFFSRLVVEGNEIFYCENPKDHHLYIVYVRPRKTCIEGSRITEEEIG